MQPYPCTCTLLHTQISNSSTQTGPESILRFLPRLAPEPIIDDLERRYRRIIVLFLPHRGCDTLKGFCSIADTVESDTAWTSHQQAAASRQPIGFLTCQPFTFVRENLNRIRQAEELDVHRRKTVCDLGLWRRIGDAARCCHNTTRRVGLMYM